MLWGWGEEQPERERERQKLQTRGRKRSQSKPGRPVEVSPARDQLPSRAPEATRGGGSVPLEAPGLAPPAPREAGSLPPLQDTAGVARAVWCARGSSLAPNQGSWRQLRVCNLGWGLTGGGGFAEGDNGEEPSPGLEQGARGASLPPPRANCAGL